MENDCKKTMNPLYLSQEITAVTWNTFWNDAKIFIWTDSKQEGGGQWEGYLNLWIRLELMFH